MADEKKKSAPDYFANREIKHFKKYITDGALDEQALKQKEGLNDAQIAQLTEILFPSVEAGAAASQDAVTEPLEAEDDDDED